MKKIIPILFILFFTFWNRSGFADSYWGSSHFAASLSVTPSETYIIAGTHPVALFCEVKLYKGDTPEIVKFEIDYENDGVVDETKVFQSPINTVTHTFRHLFETAGYWNTVVTISVDGSREVMDPVTINAARWKFPETGTIGGINSTPAAGEDGTVYFGSEDSMLYAINSDGTLKWQYMTGGPVNSSPAIDGNGNIYFGSEDGFLYCRTSDNKEKWPPFLTGDAIFGSPAFSNDEKTVYVASTDGSLYAVDTDTGKPAWPMAFSTNGKIVSSPVVGHDGTIYTGSLDCHLYAVNPDGSLLWRKNLSSDIYGGIALDGDGTIYIGTSQYGGAKDSENRFYALSPTGKEKWRANVLSGFAAPPVIYSSHVVLAGSYDNQLYAFDKNGKKLWTFTHFSDDIINSPAVGSNGLVYTASKDGMIYALIDDWDYFTGRKLAWEFDMKMPVTASSPMVVDGSVYIGTYDRKRGVLWAFAAESEEMAKALGNIVTAADPKSPWPMMHNDKQNSGKTGYTPDTIYPTIIETDPANGVDDFDLTRNSITATFSSPVDPDLLYIAPTDDSEGFYGFMVEPFEQGPEAFEIQWVSEVSVELVLPPDVMFEKDTIYSAIIQTLPKTDSGDPADAGDIPDRLLYPHTWSFSRTTPETVEYSGDRGCFISCLPDFKF